MFITDYGMNPSFKAYAKSSKYSKQEVRIKKKISRIREEAKTLINMRVAENTEHRISGSCRGNSHLQCIRTYYYYYYYYYYVDLNLTTHKILTAVTTIICLGLATKRNLLLHRFSLEHILTSRGVGMT